MALALRDGEALRLSMRDVEKRFGPTVALAGVELDAAAGEAVGIVGENGAGKSTLMGVLSGSLIPDRGTITLDGVAMAFRGPADAIAAGIAIVRQELSLCPDLTAPENIFLGREPTRSGWLAKADARARTVAILTELGIEIDLDAPVRELSLAERQLIEIARALSHQQRRVLILDEPTSSLAAGDAERLFRVLRRLKQEGVTILYISHFLEDLDHVADRFVVLRDGVTVGGGRVGESSVEEIAQRMVGRPLGELFARTETPPGDILLELRDVAGTTKPARASLALRRGEVLGIAGLVGAGRTELLRAVFGLDPVRSGTIKVGAFVGRASPARRWAEGMGFVSEDRKGEGLALSMSVADNLTLTKLELSGQGRGLERLGFVSRRRQREVAQRWIDELGVKCRGPDAKVVDLSGGNQQKIALGRLFHHDVDVLLLDEPTRGVDLASKATLYRLIDQARQDQKAVLLVSSYLPEILGSCDRIAVMTRGRLGDARPRSEWTEESIMVEAVGAPA